MNKYCLDDGNGVLESLHNDSRKIAQNLDDESLRTTSFNTKSKIYTQNHLSKIIPATDTDTVVASRNMQDGQLHADDQGNDVATWNFKTTSQLQSSQNNNHMDTYYPLIMTCGTDYWEQVVNGISWAMGSMMSESRQEEEWSTNLPLINSELREILSSESSSDDDNDNINININENPRDIIGTTNREYETSVISSTSLSTTSSPPKGTESTVTQNKANENVARTGRTTSILRDSEQVTAHNLKNAFQNHHQCAGGYLTSLRSCKNPVARYQSWNSCDERDTKRQKNMDLSCHYRQLRQDISKRAAKTGTKQVHSQRRQQLQQHLYEDDNVISTREDCRCTAPCPIM